MVIFVTMLLSVSVKARVDNLLWQISDNGLDKPSYILGSMHFAPESFIDSISGLNDVLDRVEAVYGEICTVNLDPQFGKLAIANATAQYILAPEDSTLSVLYSPEQYAFVDSVLSVELPEFPLYMVNHIKPNALSVALVQKDIASLFPDTDSNRSFDEIIMSRAFNAGKDVEGLETIIEQLEILYLQPLTEQASDLIYELSDKQHRLESLTNLTNAYFAGDLDTILLLTEAEYKYKDKRQIDTLIYKRNHKWISTITDSIPSASILFVVGAGHLPGNNGLLQMLRDRGYTISPVTE